MTLKEQLIQKDKKRWLDIGCGYNFSPGFLCIDKEVRLTNLLKLRNFFKIDILTVTQEQLGKLGKFDLVRMQHTFEHFTYEEGREVLKNVAKLLKPDGVILITVPDLKINIKKYLNHEYKNWKTFTWWAHKRIPKDAPDSFYFSIFAHSMPYEQHKWCYDYEGLEYQLKLSGEFKNIKELKVNDPLASVPFTHNRPEEDICVIAKKI